MKAFVSHPELVTDAAALDAIVAKLRAEDRIALDTEFIRESTFFPKLEIIQVATATESWLLDYPALNRRSANVWDGFLDVLQDPKILKIMHAAQGDQECFFVCFDLLPSPIFDTAIGAALLGLGDQLGLSALVRNVLNIKLKKGHARTHWGARPLPAQLQEYAHLDVRYLVEIADILMERLKVKNRMDWALEASAVFSKRETFVQDPEKMAMGLARGSRLDDTNYRVLRELMLLRERRVREVDVPRRRLADDQTLVDLALACPREIAHLRTFRGFSPKEIADHGRVWLEAVSRGLAEKSITLPRVKSREPPTEAENRAVVLLRCFVGVVADQHGIASRYLLQGDELLDLLRAAPQTVQDLWEKDLMSRAASEILGEPLLDVLHGRAALGLRQKAVEVIKR